MEVVGFQVLMELVVVLELQELEEQVVHRVQQELQELEEQVVHRVLQELQEVLGYLYLFLMKEL